MNGCWHQLGQFLWWGGTPEGAIFIVGLGAVGGVVTGILLLAIKLVWILPGVVKESWSQVAAENRFAGIEPAFTRGWNRGLAKARARRLAKHGSRPDNSHPAPPTDDITPTSDI
jgi:hypothetical protein